MASSQGHPVRRLADALPGWLFLAAGMAMLAGPLLVPAWLTQHRLDWERRLMRQQHAVLEQQAADYDRFQQALIDGEEVLLERLAFYQLRLKPADGVAVGLDHIFNVDHAGGPDPWRATSPWAAMPVAGERLPAPTVDQILHRPLPVAGGSLPAYTPPRSRLTRLTTGVTRWFVLAAGGACLVTGLYLGSPAPERRKPATANRGRAADECVEAELDEDPMDETR